MSTIKVNALRHTGGSSDNINLDSSGRVLVGTSTSRTTWKGDGVNNFFQIEYVGGGYGPGLTLYGNSSTTTRSPILTLGKSGGTTAGSFTLAPANEPIGRIHFEGADGTQSVAAATIEAYVDGTPGANDMPGRLVFSTTADGASSPTERMRISQDGAIRNMTGLYADYSGSSANVHIASDGHLTRGSSSIRYKTQVEDLEDQYADALLECRPVWYRSTSKNDNPDWSFYGLIAEELADIDPRLVQWRTTNPVFHEDGSVEHEPCEPVAEGISYDRFVPHLLNLIKRQKQQLQAQAASIASLEARLTALEG